jgi:glycosyl hydrolase group 75 (putative chitosanase)/carbohydrate binding protein with CBM35 domain/carbohydrate binding protein with CBM6 domain
VRKKPKRLVRAGALLAGCLLLGTVAVVTAVQAGADTHRYEAENATLNQAVVATNHLNYTGSGFVDYNNVAGSYVQWAFSASIAGTATLAIRFANGSTADRPMTITVNGTVVSSGLSFPVTGSWDTWQTKSITASVISGNNTVRATATGSAGGPNVDFLDVTVNPVTEYQAEDATISQGTVANNHSDYTGSGFVDYTNVTGSYVSAASAGTVGLEFRYANGSTANRPMNISVNGTVVASSAAFNPTSNWDTWAVTTINASLVAGSNKVRATATTSSGGPNLDRLRIVAPASGGAPTAEQLLAKVTSCAQISTGKYKTDSELSATIPLCQKTGAVFWKADMDIDCDGKVTTQCNGSTDPWFQADTFCHDSSGQPLNAAGLPYVVIPSASSIWDYRNYNIGCGTVVAVIYNNQVLYAVMGDTGPTDIIGEASYSTASHLGIDPDPATGGADSGVTYIVFQGSTRVSPIENHDTATSLGQQLAQKFLNNN